MKEKRHFITIESLRSFYGFRYQCVNPFENIINVECVQLMNYRTWRVVPIKEAHESCDVRCRFCLVTVGYINEPNYVSFSRFEIFETDVDDGTKIFKSEEEWDFYTTCSITSCINSVVNFSFSV